MDASTDFSIESLAARTTVKYYGDIRIVTIPGCMTLSQFERTAVFNRAQQRRMATPLYADTLMSTLRCITPPLDEEEENEESRMFETQARKELERENCPPCYPPHLDVPLRNIPVKCQAIISYWQSFPGMGDVVLRAQLSDWRKFRVFQGRIRAYYQNKPFGNFVDDVCKRRRRYGVCGDVHLRLNPEQQSGPENWIEFQNYHLKRLERFEEMRNELKKELEDIPKKAEDAEAIRQELDNCEWDLERHKVLLQWIEQKRQTMDSEYPTTAEEYRYNRDTASKAVRSTSTRDLRTRRAETSAVLGKVKITKSKLKKRNVQFQKSKALEFEPAIQNSEVIPQSTISRALKRRETKPRRTKAESPFGQTRRERVSEARRFAGAKATLLLRRQRHGAEQARCPDQARSKRRPAPQPQSVHENVKTRSGRISRPPAR